MGAHSPYLDTDDSYRVAVAGGKAAAEAAKELAQDGAVLSANPR